MIKAWLVSVGILFILAEFSLWLRNFMLPLPVYILGGAFLAIASNYERGIVALFRQQTTPTPDIISQTATLIEQRQTIAASDSKSLKLPETSQSNN